MKKYLADVLTGSRFLLAIITFWAIFAQNWGLATTAFGVGILTDVFDGMAARKWPYVLEGNQRLPPWRKDAHAFDNAADALLCAGTLVVFCISQALRSTAWWLVGLAAAGLLTTLFVWSVGFLRDRRRPKAAEFVEVAHGWYFGFLLIGLLVAMTNKATETWGWYCLGYAWVGLFLIRLKWERLWHRPELDFSPRKK